MGIEGLKFVDAAGNEVTAESIEAELGALGTLKRVVHWAYPAWLLNIMALVTDGDTVYLLDKCGNWYPAPGILVSVEQDCTAGEVQ